MHSSASRCKRLAAVWSLSAGCCSSSAAVADSPSVFLFLRESLFQCFQLVLQAASIFVELLFLRGDLRLDHLLDFFIRHGAWEFLLLLNSSIGGKTSEATFSADEDRSVRLRKPIA